MNDYFSLENTWVWVGGFLVGWCVANRRWLLNFVKLYPSVLKSVLQARKMYPLSFIDAQVKEHLAHVERAKKAESTIRFYVLSSDMTFTEKVLMLNLICLNREKYARDTMDSLDSQMVS